MPRVHLACFQVSGVDCGNMHVPSPTCVKYINYKPHREQMFSNIMELSSFTKKRKIMLKTYLQGALLGGKMLQLFCDEMWRIHGVFVAYI